MADKSMITGVSRLVEEQSERLYTGFTEDLEDRLKAHNAIVL
ncbi:MAG: hypothetical protein QF473_12150 [Planctomycetota bacterium]|nr:hypothetical protein [Planctomycetota bacterium]MDP6502175.1 hypothetical protein [Planctomycetota bacterium]